MVIVFIFDGLKPIFVELLKFSPSATKANNFTVFTINTFLFAVSSHVARKTHKNCFVFSIEHASKCKPIRTTRAMPCVTDFIAIATIIQDKMLSMLITHFMARFNSLSLEAFIGLQMFCLVVKCARTF